MGNWSYPLTGEYMWRLWCKALGEKATVCNRESDIVAAIRTFVLALYMATNLFIVAGVIRHWNDAKQVPDLYYVVEIKKD